MNLDRFQTYSSAYLKTQIALHADPRGYGGKGDKWAPAVADLVRRYGAWSVLDYGCGEGALVRALRERVDPRVRLAEYDPAIAGKNDAPSFADLVVCTDVLEHIEPDRLGCVLEHLDVLARKAVFAVIATRASNKTLLDGRNAHLTIESSNWWYDRLEQHGFHVEHGPASPLKKPSREAVFLLTRRPL